MLPSLQLMASEDKTLKLNIRPAVRYAAIGIANEVLLHAVHEGHAPVQESSLTEDSFKRCANRISADLRCHEITDQQFIARAAALNELRNEAVAHFTDKKLLAQEACKIVNALNVIGPAVHSDEEVKFSRTVLCLTSRLLDLKEW